MSTIIIKKCRAKNFLSIGNQFLEFDLQSHKYTLIVGQNGGGKSTLLDIIHYALYGKPYRDIKLAQLINSINNKDCVVEIEFSIGGIEYLVRRGMKPGIFEIYKNSELVTVDAASRDYQKVLENQILKMNSKTFRQLVVIGSATYKPFMQLKAGERREIIEDVLDISIFSKMGELSRSIEREFKSDITRMKSELSIRTESLNSSTNSLYALLGDIDRLNKTRDTEIASLNEKNAKLHSRLTEILSEIESLREKTKSYDDLKAANRKIDVKIAGIENDIGTKEAAIKKAQSIDHCPTCKQDYPLELKEQIIAEYSSGLDTQKETLAELKSAAVKLDDKVKIIETDVESLRSLMTEAKVISSELTGNNSRINSLNDTSGIMSGVNTLQESISETSNLISTLNETIAQKETELEYYSVISSMLKDSGIKATIVARYLPVINKLINQYLEQFGMFVGFELSPTFEETIKARHRDTYSYNSFSEGEKSKIDCAILMTWRHIAAAKATMNCNILILDEIGGHSLDFDAHGQMIELIGNSADNVFLITHRETEEDLFDRVWEFSKPKNYTQMQERLN